MLCQIIFPRHFFYRLEAARGVLIFGKFQRRHRLADSPPAGDHGHFAGFSGLPVCRSMVSGACNGISDLRRRDETGRVETTFFPKTLRPLPSHARTGAAVSDFGESGTPARQKPALLNITALS